ncbi:MAG: SUMF1/EgtB/PvdO family nonheme iron enzyme [Deltaproteobacteria bacterium]|nr:SUMF1/EgtB/PvdO family nonheme iron enzyme [Deltaproteobacteria bacterium]
MLKIIIFQKHLFIAVSLCLCAGCFVDPVCYSNADCVSQQSCDVTSGQCVDCMSNSDCGDSQICDLNLHECEIPECLTSDDCNLGFECVSHGCRARTLLYCPGDMVSISNLFCIDRYEASKPDASETSQGIDNSKAVSKAGVKPWVVESNSAAQAACVAAGKTLCDETQWQMACEGPENHTYAYGDAYESATCNGIDTFCLCDSCQTAEACSYEYCFADCGAAFRLMPTGSFPGCTNAFGVFDMNGNLWEHVLNGNDTTIRGGAYNCRDSRLLHQCSYIPGNWTPSARGFRCCAVGSLYPFESDTNATAESAP